MIIKYIWNRIIIVNSKLNMGNSEPVVKKKESSLEDIVLELKMASKRFQSESNRAEKEKQKQMNKAKEAVKKGNDESAKLYLANAAQKQNESMSLLRMAHKMDALTCTVRNNTSSTVMMAQLNNLVPALNRTSQQFPVEKMYQDMQNFEKSMDQIIVATNVNIHTKNISFIQISYI